MSAVVPLCPTLSPMMVCACVICSFIWLHSLSPTFVESQVTGMVSGRQRVRMLLFPEIELLWDATYLSDSRLSHIPQKFSFWELLRDTTWSHPTKNVKVLLLLLLMPFIGRKISNSIE